MTRTDGLKFFFTDHDTKIAYNQEIYLPTDSVSSSARQQQAGLKPSNTELTGVISSSQITLQDIRSQKYRDCKIEEILIDWKYPDNGPLFNATYWISDVKWDGETWQAEIEGQSRWLRVEVGRTFTRNCRHQLGDGFLDGIGCSVNIGTLFVRNIRVGTVTDNRIFSANSADLSGTFTRDRFRFGEVQWLTGSNVGYNSEILDYTPGTRTIELFLKTPFDIQATDTFDLKPGCGKTQAICTNEYDNFPDHGGFLHMPGTNKLIRAPRT